MPFKFANGVVADRCPRTIKYCTIQIGSVWTDSRSPAVGGLDFENGLGFSESLQLKRPYFEICY